MEFQNLINVGPLIRLLRLEKKFKINKHYLGPTFIPDNGVVKPKTLQISYFQSHFSASKINRIFLNLFSVKYIILDQFLKIKFWKL